MTTGHWHVKALDFSVYLAFLTFLTQKSAFLWNNFLGRFEGSMGIFRIPLSRASGGYHDSSWLPLPTAKLISALGL